MAIKLRGHLELEFSECGMAARLVYKRIIKKNVKKFDIKK